MKILIAPDKFKGSLSALEVCKAIENGLKKNNPSLKILLHPMADGGDGSLDVLDNHLSLKAKTVETTDPLGRTISAQYFTSADAAFIELARTSGIDLLTVSERNPLVTTSFGTGKMIADAISEGFREVFLFLGGSATNDAGMGIAAALGFKFLDKEKKELAPIGGNLSKVQFIVHPAGFTKIKMTLLCDVTNPLFGPLGAAHVYAPQKGATAEQVKCLDDGLVHFGKILREQSGMKANGRFPQIPGAGAAGGIGAGLAALFHAELKSGFATIAHLTRLENKIQHADWVISGEGKLDVQSLQGKVVNGVADLCKKHGKPLSLFVGQNDLSEKDAAGLGVKDVFAVLDLAAGLEEAMEDGRFFLEKLATKMERTQ